MTRNMGWGEERERDWVDHVMWKRKEGVSGGMGVYNCCNSNPTDKKQWQRLKNMSNIQDKTFL